MVLFGFISVLQCFCKGRKSPRLCLTVFFVKKCVISMNYIFITSLTVENLQSANVKRAGSSVDPLRRASLPFPHPFYCDWLRPAPASLRPELSSDSMFSCSSAGTVRREPPFGKSGPRVDALGTLRATLRVVSLRLTSLCSVYLRYAPIRSGCGDGSSLRLATKGMRNAG
jgi:hypothetical protein